MPKNVDANIAVFAPVHISKSLPPDVILATNTPPAHAQHHCISIGRLCNRNSPTAPP
jgi:hypothetical protein